MGVELQRAQEEAASFKASMMASQSPSNGAAYRATSPEVMAEQAAKLKELEERAEEIAQQNSDARRELVMLRKQEVIAKNKEKAAKAQTYMDSIKGKTGYEFNAGRPSGGAGGGGGGSPQKTFTATVRHRNGGMEDDETEN